MDYCFTAGHYLPVRPVARHAHRTGRIHGQAGRARRIGGRPAGFGNFGRCHRCRIRQNRHADGRPSESKTNNLPRQPDRTTGGTNRTNARSPIRTPDCPRHRRPTLFRRPPYRGRTKAEPRRPRCQRDAGHQRSNRPLAAGQTRIRRRNRRQPARYRYRGKTYGHTHHPRQPLRF